MELNRGDKVVLKLKYGDKSNIHFFRSFLVVSREEYEDAKKISEEDKCEINEIFDLTVHERIVVEGSPLHNAVVKSELGAWISVTTHMNSKEKDSKTEYRIENIIPKRKSISFDERIMKQIDPKWYNYSDIDNNKVDEGIKALDEHILLALADHINKGEYILAVTLLHGIKNGWSYMRVINVLKGTKERRLRKTYGYFPKQTENDETKTQ